MIKVNIRPVNFRSKNARIRERPRVNARAKVVNAQNRFKIIKHFIKNRAHAHERTFSRVKLLHNIESPFFFSS